MKGLGWFNRDRQGERGQIILLMVFVLTILLGMSALVIDVGFWLGDRRTAQNQADALALAAGSALPDEAAASAAANEWAARNTLPPDQLVCCEFEDKNSDGKSDLVRVRVERESRSFFARALRVFSMDIGASAAAGQLQVVGSCVAPWAIEAANSDPNSDYGLDRYAVYIFELATGDFATPGNFGALAFYGQGVVNYRDAIVNSCGSNGETACNSDGAIIEEGETLSCETQTGALGANTASALNERYDSSAWGACDVQTEQTNPTDSDGDGQPDQWEEALEKSTFAECQDRVLPIAIIDGFPDQGSSSDVNIYGTLSFYVAGWDRTAPYGSGDTDGDPASGMVWGYLIPYTADPIWLVELGESSNPFAAIVVALVE